MGVITSLNVFELEFESGYQEKILYSKMDKLTRIRIGIRMRVWIWKRQRVKFDQEFKDFIQFVILIWLWIWIINDSWSYISTFLDVNEKYVEKKMLSINVKTNDTRRRNQD